jgi:predicted RNA-binding Zn-ribbon protein involved in translation (DUF1610 family)
VYCPKCGDELVSGEEGLECTRGGMQLSPNLARDFSAAYPECAPGAEHGRPVAKFYCPGCGGRIPPVPHGVMPVPNPTCPKCGKQLKRQWVYQLIEMHPHWDEEAGKYA